MIARLYGQARGAARHEVEIDATLRDPSRQASDVVVEDLSTTGFRIGTTVPMGPGTHFSIGFAGLGVCAAEAVREANGRYGCRFLQPLTEAELHTTLTAVPLTPLPLRTHQQASLSPGGGADIAPLRSGLPLWLQVGVAAVTVAGGWWMLTTLHAAA